MSSTTDAQPGKEDLKVAEPSLPVASAAESSKPVAAPVADKPKTSAAELKKQKQAEKAARRAKVIEKKVEAGTAGAGVGPSTVKQKEDSADIPVDTEKNRAQPDQPVGDDKVRSSSDSKHAKQAGVQQQPSSHSTSVSKQKKEVSLWSHLPDRKHPGSSPKDDLKAIHQDVRILGLQMEAYIVCGSNSRLVAMLTVLKTVSILVFTCHVQL